MNLYGALDVSHSASDEEIRKAYKRKALETHPDRLGPSASQSQRENAQTHFQKIREAFVVLSDANKRRAYDASLATQTGSESKPFHKPDCKASDEQLSKMRDRTEWAQQQRKRDEERINAMREKDKQAKDEENRKAREAKMTQEFVQDLFAVNPEWDERRKRVSQQTAQREKVKSRQWSLPT